MNGPREGWTPCPGNNCGDPLDVTTVDGRMMSWPAQCPSCRTLLHLPPDGPVTYEADPLPFTMDASTGEGDEQPEPAHGVSEVDE